MSKHNQYNTENKQKSYYYQLLVRKEGEKKANLYWNRRNRLSTILMLGSMDCEKINRLCDKFMARHETIKWH